MRKAAIYLSFYLQYYKRRKADASYDPVNSLVKLYGRHGVSPELLFLGDSVSERISMYDSDKRNLYEMTADMLKGTSSGCISYSAYHIGIYYLLIEALRYLNNRPSFIIMPVNLRSFSPQWDMNPLFQCASHMRNIKSIILKTRKDVALEYFDDPPNSVYRFLNTRVDYPLTSCKKIADFMDIIYRHAGTDEARDNRYKQLFIFHYLYPLRFDHPKLLQLEKIISLIRDMGIKLFLYITPVNYKAGLKYVGNEFQDGLSRTLSTIKSHLINIPAAGVVNEFDSCEDILNFQDLSTILDPDYFFNEHESTEHLNEKGREVVAKHISRAITGPSV